MPDHNYTIEILLISEEFFCISIYTHCILPKFTGRGKILCSIRLHSRTGCLASSRPVKMKRQTVKTGLNIIISHCWHDPVLFQIEVILPLPFTREKWHARHCTYFHNVFYATLCIPKLKMHVFMAFSSFQRHKTIQCWLQM